MLGNTILHQNDRNGQHTPQDAFNQAFNTTSQETIQPNNDTLQKALFVSQKVYFYKQELKRLQADLKKTEVLLRGHETWLSELVKKLENEQ